MTEKQCPRCKAQVAQAESVCPSCGQTLLEPGPPPIPHLRTNVGNPVVAGLLTALLILFGLGIGAAGLCMGLVIGSAYDANGILYAIGGILIGLVFILLAVKVSRGGNR